MKNRITHTRLNSLMLAALLLCGCRSEMTGGYPSQPRPLGSVVDQMNQLQEDNAEAAKLVIYMHEFELNKPEWEDRLGVRYDGPPQGFRLTPYGQDHVRRIAAVLSTDGYIDMPVIVERNQTSVRQSTKHRYSVHYGDALDRERREIIVEALTILGVHDADSRVMVGPAFSEGLSAQEAASAYGANFGQQSSGGGGGGGGGLGGGQF